MVLTKFFVIGVLFISQLSVCQQKVAILDFENTSKISKYDGYGKALANMLITDLRNSIHPRKITFIERSQLNNILKEQQLQKSINFDNSTTVNFGKLVGVQYVILGSVYILDGTCNITSRMVNVETSEIEFSKESNGEITKWLQLKSNLAEQLSFSLNNPIEIDEAYKVVTSENVISQYANVIEEIDNNNLTKAEELNTILGSVIPDFKYFEELKLDLETLKQQVSKNTEKIDVIFKEIDSVQSDIAAIYDSKGQIIDPQNLWELDYNLFWYTTSPDDRLRLIKTILSYPLADFKINKIEFQNYNRMPYNVLGGVRISKATEKDLKFIEETFIGLNGRVWLNADMGDEEDDYIILYKKHKIFIDSLNIQTFMNYFAIRYLAYLNEISNEVDKYDEMELEKKRGFYYDFHTINNNLLWRFRSFKQDYELFIGKELIGTNFIDKSLVLSFEVSELIREISNSNFYFWQEARKNGHNSISVGESDRQEMILRKNLDFENNTYSLLDLVLDYYEYLASKVYYID